MSSFKPSRHLLPLLLSALLCGPVVAQVPSKAYAQELVDRTAARHPGLLGMTLYATPGSGSGPVMIASTICRIGQAAGEHERQAIAAGEILASERDDLRAVTLRGFSGGKLMILGSNFGRHGKKGDEEDMKVLNSTEPETGLHVDGRRFNVDLSLRDPAGKPMGTLTVGYAYRNGDDTQALVARALAVRKLIESRASANSLEALDL